ncbi:threonine-phosphate decarboxylase [Crassaminicella thermophila]|uniref:threonine-phosphate decarboxylase n=1 Tax=Crassaminicella thermophila TaxID=2599308 RepID=A0A5C0SFU5_CRATE|nr:threonine-phosphate decarboxylase CobD [Crassaminicella thermophila]QEK11809.1 threonine-phosphate decarboxylase [Crassaminicella thermophila]
MKCVKHGGNIYEIADKLGVGKEEIIDFSANINPLGLPDSYKEALVKNINIIENYPDPKYRGLVEAIANYHHIDNKYITVGNGATEVIFSIIENLKPRRSLILAPTFLEYERALIRAGSYVEYYYLKEENDFQIEDEFLKDIDENLDLIILCNPNNPTSQLIDKNRMVKIINHCKKNNISLMIDEAFVDFVDDPDQVTMLSFVKDYKNLYIIRALTKFFAIPGLRIGYGITSNENLLKNINDYKEPWTINSYAAMAGEVVLKDQFYIKRSREWIMAEKVHFYSQLKKINSIKVYKPKANYILFKLLGDKKDLREALLKKKILIRSCSNYINMNNSFYRIAIKDRKTNEKFIKALKEVLYES